MGGGGGGGHHATLQKSQSFGFNGSSGLTSGQGTARAVRSRSSSCEDLVKEDLRSGGKMFQRQKHPDPLASLPSSQNRQYPAHSPSPSQSEYDTCDPWDDYWGPAASHLRYIVISYHSQSSLGTSLQQPDSLTYNQTYPDIFISIRSLRQLVKSLAIIHSQSSFKCVLILL